MIRKTLVAVSAVLSLVFMASTASAQTVDDIIAKNLAAKGGVEKIKAIQSIRTTGTMSGMGPQSASLLTISKRPNLSRQEITVNGQAIVMAFDGTAARMINPMAGPGVIDVPAEQVEMIKDQSDMDGPLVDYKAKGSTIEFIGSELVDGKQVIHLRISRKMLPVQEVLLDAKTFLETKITTQVPGSGVFETVLSDYRDVQGLMMPFSIKTIAAGMTVNEVKLSKIELNPVLDDAAFKIK